MIRPVIITPHHIHETLAYLQEGGRRGVECVVLWLAQDDDDAIRVQRVYRPDQQARADIFRIPAASMSQLMSTLSTDELMIGAQVHSHPREAFHSLADDTWAIVRHVGALSLVVPDFALKTTPASFMSDTKTFCLTPTNRWAEVPQNQVKTWLKTT